VSEPTLTDGRRYVVALVTGMLAVVVIGSSVTAAAKTKRVSVAKGGAEATDASNSPSLSKTGRYVAFHSQASNLDAGPDANVGGDDVFIRNNKTGKIFRASVSSGGTPGNDVSRDAVLSADGRYVAFWSRASNLVGNDSNGAADVFIHDRKSRKTKRLSLSSKGKQGADSSVRPAISASGRFVAFESAAPNLVNGDKKGHMDIFVRDRATKKTRRVSIRSNGKEANADSYAAGISANGRYVVFTSDATNLVGNDSNGHADVFIHDRVTRKTTRASVRSNGKQAKGGPSYQPTVSAGGRHVVFTSIATNLAKNDAKGSEDIFLRDRKRKKTFLISKHTNGTPGNNDSNDPVISGSGRFVVFDSKSTSLVNGETNGKEDAYRRDRKRKKTKRVSVKTGGGEVFNGGSHDVTISQDGRWVAFDSTSDTIVPLDTNGDRDVFRRGPLN